MHRDIKPANLLVGVNGMVKVTDFGVARAFGHCPWEDGDAVIGTVGYLSPEQASGEPVTPASDRYALGWSPTSAWPPQRPFTAEHPIAVALAHLLNAPPPLPDDIPVVVASLVSRAMAKSPKRRPADAAMLGHHLLALRKGLEAGNVDAA